MHMLQVIKGEIVIKERRNNHLEIGTVTEKFLDLFLGEDAANILTYTNYRSIALRLVEVTNRKKGMCEGQDTNRAVGRTVEWHAQHLSSACLRMPSCNTKDTKPRVKTPSVP